MRVTWTAELLHDDCAECSALADEMLSPDSRPTCLFIGPDVRIDDVYTNYGTNGHSIFVFPQITREVAW